MEFVHCKDEFDWVQQVHQNIESEIKAHKAKRVILPAGETPRPLYRYWREVKPGFLNTLTLVQLDEILNKSGVFKNFFVNELPEWKNRFEWIESAEKAADVSIIGLGLNGHVGFHEPGIANEFYSGCICLSESTTQRLDIKPGTWGVTYGVSALLQSKSLILLVRGESKKNILKEITSGKSDLPAAHLLKHGNIKIIADFKI